MKKHLQILLGLLVVSSLLLVACGGTPSATEPVDVEPTAVDEEPTAAPEEPSEPVEIRWFVGLGAGAQPEQLEGQEAVVAAFNEAHDDIELVLEIVQNDVASDTLSTQIAAGNAPDIVGPVGVEGSNLFTGLFADLDPLIEASGYDLAAYDPATVEFYREASGELTGLPFAVYPSFIYYNTTLFDEAGLEYPPHAVGDPYILDGEEVEWNFDTLREIGMRLTVDAAGNDATSDAFDPANIVQFGYHTQFTDARGEATLFGAASFVDASGNAVIPENWSEYFNYANEAVWTDYWMPNNTYLNSDLLAAGNAFGSGNTAMAHIHLWCHACYAGADFDIAVVPSYNGVTTAKLHADTFKIMASSENPQEAFTVLSYLLDEGAPTLLIAYGGMPARIELQADYFATLDDAHEQEIDWEVAVAMLGYPDNPNHQSNMPNFARATERINEFQSLWRGTAGVDIDAELATLQDDLQAIFDEAQ
jgi:multiple sugar transport system substrate-binding protein